MRILPVAAVSLLMLVLAAPASAMSKDPLVGLRFTDGQARSAKDFANQTILLVYFCGHCPSAASWMKSRAKAIQDEIETNHRPAVFVCITPDKTPAEMIDYGKELGLDHALLASDPANSERIGLQNILQTWMITPDRHLDLMPQSVADVATKLAGKDAGTFRYPVDGLTDPRAIELWWAVERGRPKAMPTLTTVAKRKSPLQDDAAKILAVVSSAFTSRQEALVALPPSMEAYEGLERLLAEGESLDLKPALARLKELTKAPEMKDELAARKLFQQCQAQAESNKTPEQAAAKDNFAKLAKRYPDTAYGKMAAGK